MEGCIFCAIAKREQNVKIEYEDDQVFAFPDISPKAPIHILVIPKKHISSVAQLEEENEGLAGRLILTAKKIAAQKGISESGYRLIFNVGPHSGQAVDHIHLHLLGGKPLGAMV